MDINEIANRAYENAKRLGKINNSRNAIEKLKDVQGEYTEALQALSVGDYARMDLYNGWMANGESFEECFTGCVKDTYEQELTDLLFVVLTLMKDTDMDIDNHVDMGLRFNEVREKI